MNYRMIVGARTRRVGTAGGSRQVLSLDDRDWGRLEHAYGPASDIPDLLRQLERDTRPTAKSQAEPWHSLWSSLCHQDKVYTASYATVPHIVRICLDARGPIDFCFFQLPACVEIARANGRGPPIPAALSAPYDTALRQLHECAFKHAADEWDQSMALCVTAALAVAKGQIIVAEAIINLDSDIMRRIIKDDL